MTRGAGTKTVIFSGQTTFKEVEILPTSAFRIGKVLTVIAGGKKRPPAVCKREGDGLDCSLTIPTASIGQITFTAPRTNARTIYGLPGAKDSAEVLLHGASGTGDRAVVETVLPRYDLEVRPAGGNDVIVTIPRSLSVTDTVNRPILVVKNVGAARSRPATLDLAVVTHPPLTTHVFFSASPRGSCYRGDCRIDALAPGESVTITLRFLAPALARAKWRGGLLSIRASLTCDAEGETRCDNNPWPRAGGRALRVAVTYAD
jgi:hypothetical protein